MRHCISHPSIVSLDDFLFGHAPAPVRCRSGLEFGGGQVVPEINFTLPSMEVNEENWPEVRRQYGQMIESICRRAIDLEVPGLLVEFETLPPMTSRPEWGLEIAELLSATLAKQEPSMKGALRLTPNDNRDHERPPLMRRGFYWEKMVELFVRAGSAGADLLSIESTGGKEISDEALMEGDLRKLVFALGILASRDMEFLWGTLTQICKRTGVIPGGDTACGFANTAMVLAQQKLTPKTFAAVVRAATVPRSLIAYEMGAHGPSKDCAYEGPYMKAMAGVPISMEGRSAACAHLSPVGNIAQAVCDCWSNESVQNVKLLSAHAPVVSMEQLAYDCRLMNVVLTRGKGEAQLLRDWLTESDAALDPQAHILRPDVVLRLSKSILEEKSDYDRTCRAAREAVLELNRAAAAGELKIAPRERIWLDRLDREAEALPSDEGALIEEMRLALEGKFDPAEYGL